MWAKISTAAFEPSSWTLLVGLSCEGDFINVSSHEAARGAKARERVVCESTAAHYQRRCEFNEVSLWSFLCLD